MKVRWLLALLIFFATIATRWPLVDKLYQYSFQPDSEAGVNITRSFYFFFKNPRLENAPQTLSGYPTYFDGSYICAAITANLIRPLVRHGIITAGLSDGDDSIIIFSMRWSSVVFDALSAVFLFLILCLLTANQWLSVIVVLMYYLLSNRILDISLMRVDHYKMLTLYAAIFFSVKIFKNPDDIWNFLGAGFFSAAASATKINFPVYLCILPIVLVWLMFERSLRAKAVLLMGVAYLSVIIIFFQRWLLYPEKALDTLKEIIGVGKEWSLFFEKQPYFYFHWHQFFAHDFNWGTYVFVLSFYLAFGTCLYKAIKNKNSLLIILCVTFIIQSVVLAFIMPKVGRYGKIMPLWVSIFFVVGLQEILKKYSIKTVCLLAATILLPKFVNSISYYKEKVQEFSAREGSIYETRVAAAEWLNTNAPPGSKILVYHPRVSNPPIFERPYKIEEIKFPFLDRTTFLEFMPTSINELAWKYNYFVVADKEKEFHLSNLKSSERSAGMNHPESASLKWDNFYDSLDNGYKKLVFSSQAENYGVRQFDIYCLNTDRLYNPPRVINLQSKEIDDDTVELSWDAEGNSINSFQVQIAADSSFRWLIHGSLDGFKSKYRKYYSDTMEDHKFIPAQVSTSIENGEFERLTGLDFTSDWEDINSLFRNILLSLKNDSIDFETSLHQLLPNQNDRQVLKSAFETILTPGVMRSRLQEYLVLTRLPEKVLERTQAQRYRAIVRLEKNSHLMIYWRVRIKEQERVHSSWSNIAKIN